MAETDHTPAYAIGRDADGLTARDREVRDLLKQGKSQPEIREVTGLGKQRVWQIVQKLKAKGVVTEVPAPPPRPSAVDRQLYEELSPFTVAVRSGRGRLICVECPPLTATSVAVTNNLADLVKLAKSHQHEETKTA